MPFSKNKSAILKEAERIRINANTTWQEPSEWLETNGLGGWASSSITGCNTRRYHGLLIAAINPPADRIALVSKLDETIITGNNRYELNTNDYGDAIHPQGFQYIRAFSKHLFPEWIYETNEVVLKKTIAMVHGENTTLILYEVLQASSTFNLELLPLIPARDYHTLQHASNHIHPRAIFKKGIFQAFPHQELPAIFISLPHATYRHHPQWYNHFNYAVEQYRGLDHVEDLFNYGTFNIELHDGDKLGIIISTENPDNRNAFELFEKEKARKQSLIQNISNEVIQQLTLAADQFIVKRDEALKTVIAGYHWFTDWGRDTMIALAGLCLSTGRYEDARKIIKVFAQNVSMGMIPNRFLDNNNLPEYNNVDGTLWYFTAVYKYLHHTGDKAFLLKEVLPVLKEIIDWHFKGTRYSIHVDGDGLLYAGEKGRQLTWMDARIGDWVATPRMGKPVEVQALWFNALKIFAELLELNGQKNDAILVRISAEKAKQGFLEKFWYAEGGYLYDVINENNIPDAAIRPNQLFAISLPFPLIDGEKANAVLTIIEKKLYTPVGLRSLSPDDASYIGLYGGNVFKRDSAYHQGTVWSWLLGPYIDAIMSERGFIGLDGLSGKEKAQKIIQDFIFHLNEACIGSVSEIFDGDAAHCSRGCIAQAWSVAEILRVIKDYEMEV